MAAGERQRRGAKNIYAALLDDDRKRKRRTPAVVDAPAKDVPELSMDPVEASETLQDEIIDL